MARCGVIRNIYEVVENTVILGELEERTCSYCAMGLVDSCSIAVFGVLSGATPIVSDILQSTSNRMEMDQDWRLQMLIGVGCWKKPKSGNSVARCEILRTLFRIRAKLLQAHKADSFVELVYSRIGGLLCRS